MASGSKYRVITEEDDEVFPSESSAVANEMTITEHLLKNEEKQSRRRRTSKGSTIELSRSFFLRQKSATGTHSCLSFHDVKYSVKISHGFLRGHENKGILHDVNGIFSPGLNAIMGPTGSGKTTLLDLLAMRKEPEGFSGLILLEGQPLPSDFKLISCYVVQDDVVLGTLTVRENLTFSAKLRLRGQQRFEIEERVEQVLLDLGLEKCADTLIGSDLIKGVSGGERKRCNIGVELLTQPTILFLDEPTTGLDSTTAYNVMNHLKTLASHGRTVIFSIHQPRYSIFKLFDKLHLLTKGKTAYHGPANKALNFFASCGFPCDTFNNPPDFFLDVIMECEGEDPFQVLRQGGRKMSQRQSSIRSRRSRSSTTRSEYEKVAQKKYNLSMAYEESQYNKVLMDELREEKNFSRTAGTTIDLKHFTVDYPVNFFSQCYYICERLFRNTKRNPGPVVSQMIVGLVFGLVGGLFFYDTGSDFSTQSGYQNRQGVAFFTIANSLFGGVAVVTIFVTDRPLFLHESANGFYRISSYFISKFLMDVIPLRTIPTIIFATLLYWMAGMKAEVDAFFLYMFTAWLCALSGCSAGLAVSATFNVIPVAILSVTTTYVLMLMFGGFYIDVDNIPTPFNYLEYISIIRYGLSAVEIVELQDEVFYDTTTGRNITKTGEEYLRDAGIEFATKWDYWKNHVGMGVILFGCFIITYVRLRLIKKLK